MKDKIQSQENDSSNEIIISKQQKTCGGTTPGWHINNEITKAKN